MLLTVVLRESRFHNALTTRKLTLFSDVALENTLTEKEIKWITLWIILTAINGLKPMQRIAMQPIALTEEWMLGLTAAATALIVLAILPLKKASCYRRFDWK
jgi:hypothetical protein